MAVVVAVAFALTGCGPDYDHTEISGQRIGSLGGRVDRSRIEVPEGMIVTAHIVAYNDDDEVMSTSVRSADPNVVDVREIITEHDYAFVGMRVGTTDIEIAAGGKTVLVISAVVVPQP